MKNKVFRTAYDFGDTSKYGWRNEGVDPNTGEVITLESACRAEFADYCNVNKIIERWSATGVLEHTARHQGQYGDFIGPDSYHEALNAIKDAESMFMTLPAEMRDRFENNTGKFLAFVNDDANLPEMIEMGIHPPIPMNAQSEPASVEAAAPPNDGAEAESPAQDDAAA